MSGRRVPPPPPPPLPPPPFIRQVGRLGKQKSWSGLPGIPRPKRLQKANSWSPDLHRDEAWQRKREKCVRESHGDGGDGGLVRSKSVISDEDIAELKGSMELGFGFDSPEVDIPKKLSDTFPALGLYQAMNKQYHRSMSSMSLSRSSSASSLVSTASDNDSDQGSASSIYDPGDDPETVKTRLRQWAQLVACSVKYNKSN